MAVLPIPFTFEVHEGHHCPVIVILGRELRTGRFAARVGTAVKGGFLPPIDLMRAGWKVLAAPAPGVRVEFIPGTPAEAPPPACCPRPRQREAEPIHAPLPVNDSSVIDNLKKLEEARELMRKAEALRRAGAEQRARACYERVRALCPGSRHDLAAAEALRRLGAAEEEAEPNADCPCEHKARELEKVRILYQKAHELHAAGELEAAQACYEKVMRQSPRSLYGQKAARHLRDIGARMIFEDLRKLEDEWQRLWRTHEDDATDGEECDPAPRKESARPAPATERRVAELLEGCHKALVRGRCAEAAELARRALMLDPAGVAAHPLVYRMHLLEQLRQKQQEAGQAPPVILVPTLPPTDPCIVEALEKVLAEEVERVVAPRLIRERGQPVEEEAEEKAADRPQAAECRRGCCGRICRMLRRVCGASCVDVDVDRDCGCPRVCCQCELAGTTIRMMCLGGRLKVVVTQCEPIPAPVEASEESEDDR
jgi:hypothetical protein